MCRHVYQLIVFQVLILAALAYETHAEPAAKGAVAVKYNNPAKGFVSLAICRQEPDVAQGQIVRTLFTKAARDAGDQTEMWDGLDDFGKPVPPGTYILKGLVHDGIKPKFICSVMNSGNPSWGNKGGHYGWGADHGKPNAAASDADGNTYLLWTVNEGGNYLIKVDKDGQKQWGADGRGAAVLYEDGVVYVAYNEWPTGASTTYGDWMGDMSVACEHGLRAYDAKTGQFLRSVAVGKFPKTVYDKSIDSVPPAKRMAAGDYTPMDHADNLAAMASGPDRIYGSLYMQNQIVALDKKTLQVRETYDVRRPNGLAYDAAKQILYVVSDQSLVALDIKKGGAARVIVASGLEYPYGLARDSRGNLWASVRGHQMQVLGFSPDGKPVGKIGKDNGRPWVGKYDPSGMLMPAGIAIDAQDHLWVPEEDETPKRVSLWDVNSGTLVKEFFGSPDYAPMMAPDPEKPEEVYLHNCRFIVDYDKGTWRPDATVFRENYGGFTIQGPMQFMGFTFEISRFAGHTFAYDGRGGIYAVEGDRFRPLFYYGNAFNGTVRNLTPAERHGTVIEWIDKNHDGLVSDDEVRQVTKRPYEFGFMGNMSGNWGGVFLPGAQFSRGFKWFIPSGLTPDGVPIYPKIEDAPPVITGNGPMSVYFTDNGKFGADDYWPFLNDRSADFFAITSGVGKDAIARITREGNAKWFYRKVVTGFALNAPLSRTGDLFGAMRIAGNIQTPPANGGQIVSIGCYRGYFGFVNEDGLYIDQVGYDNGRGPTPNFDVFFIENFSGYFFKHPKTGKVYLFCGDVDGRILELEGWNSIRRIADANVTVSEEQYHTVLAESAANHSTGGAAKSLTVSRRTPALDGKQTGWDRAALSTIRLDETHEAHVGLASDETNLYAMFDVPDDSSWRNASTDWRYPFKGGDAVDIQIGPRSSGEGKRKPQSGDVRIIVSPSPDGKTCQAVAMWKLAPPAACGLVSEPMTYTSPTGDERFERIAQLSDVKAKLTPRADGYTLELAIPWKKIGLTLPNRFTQLQGDLGILCSDRGGTKTTLRRYLFSENTGIVNDVPNEVRINFADWGVFNFE